MREGDIPRDAATVSGGRPEPSRAAARSSVEDDTAVEVVVLWD